MIYEEILETDSTNTYLALHEKELPSPLMLTAATQKAGRGQRGNSWESEPGKNITVSVLWRPAGLRASDQFAISEATALAVVDYLAGRGIEARVKWPNDIYVGDDKICGILIEHSVTGTTVERSILGIGINVNQTLFTSPAPNPVSMTQLTGREYDLDEERAALGESLDRLLPFTETEEGRAQIHAEFRRGVWRGDGLPHAYRDSAGGLFRAVISDIEPKGMLVLEVRPGGEIRRFAFKEVEFLLREPEV